MKKILMTGAGGYIGRHLLPLLASRFEVVVIGRRRPDGFQGEFVACDLLKDSLSSLCNALQAHTLVHLAWNVQGDYWHSPENTAWTRATLQLANAFLDAGGAYVMAVGSCAEYRWESHEPFQPGITPLNHNNPYAAAKNQTLQQLNDLCQLASVPFSWARLFFSFGPGEPESKLVSSLISQWKTGQIAHCYQGNQCLDYLYVKDQAKALCCVIEQQFEGVLNIASGQGVYLPDFLKLLAQGCGRSHQLRVIENVPAEMRYVLADVTHLLELGWKPSYTLEQGLEEMIKGWMPLE